MNTTWLRGWPLSLLSLLILSCSQPLVFPELSFSLRLERELSPAGSFEVRELNSNVEERDVPRLISLAPPPGAKNRMFLVFPELYGGWDEATLLILDGENPALAADSLSPLRAGMNAEELRLILEANTGATGGNYPLRYLSYNDKNLDRSYTGIFRIQGSWGEAVLGVLQAEYSGQPMVELIGPTPYDAFLEGDEDQPYRNPYRSPFWDLQLWANEMASVYSFLDSRISADTGEYRFMGLEVNDPGQESVRALVFHWPTLLMYETETPFSVNDYDSFSMSASPSPMLLHSMLSFPADDTGNPDPRYSLEGTYRRFEPQTGTPMGYLSVMDRDELRFVTLAWEAGNSGVSGEAPLASEAGFLRNSDGSFLRGRLRDVLHDGTLLLEEGNDWIFYQPPGESPTPVIVRIKRGAFRYQAEFLNPETGTHELHLAIEKSELNESGDGSMLRSESYFVSLDTLLALAD